MFKQIMIRAMFFLALASLILSGLACGNKGEKTPGLIITPTQTIITPTPTATLNTPAPTPIATPTPFPPATATPTLFSPATSTPGSPIPTPTSSSSTPQPIPLTDPFAGRNMFFGITLINPIRDAAYIKELGASWLSLQPHVIWFAIEKEPGVYAWSDVDSEVKALQALGLDITMVLSPAINAFGAERQEMAKLIARSPSMTGFLREGNVDELELYPHDETLPLWINFIKAAVARYDGDGKDDLKGLRYAVKNWHFIEEYPISELKDEKIYVDLLKVTYDAIKGEDLDSKVILCGLAGNYLRYFAFMDGYIADDEAGIIDSQKHTRLWWNANPFWRNAKKQYEYILEAGKDYFDVMDIHCYIIKESFMEGEIDYIQKTMQRYGYLKQVWIIEGGGPFKNYPGKKAENTPGDPYFGFGSEKENAEFVVKLHAMSAAKGVEREHWGLGLENTDEGYWDGPWKGMALMDPDEHYKKPSYYTFKIMREKLDGFTRVRDLSQGNLRIFSFTVGNHTVYLIWNAGSDIIADLSNIFGIKDVKITHIVTELDSKRNPIYQQDETRSAQALPVILTPIFIDISK